MRRRRGSALKEKEVLGRLRAKAAPKPSGVKGWYEGKRGGEGEECSSSLTVQRDATRARGTPALVRDRIMKLQASGCRG